MGSIKFITAALLLAVAALHQPVGAAADTAPSPPDSCQPATPQAADIATIQSLEKAWLAAEYRGDARFLDCLLSPGYQVILVKKNTVKSKADLLARVVGKQGSPVKPPPPLHTTAVLNGTHATAYSWITDENGNTVASYVDFYELHDGRWTAIGGVDL
jgi:hypothetical protein